MPEHSISTIKHLLITNNKLLDRRATAGRASISNLTTASYVLIIAHAALATGQAVSSFPLSCILLVFKGQQGYMEYTISVWSLVYFVYHGIFLCFISTALLVFVGTLCHHGYGLQSVSLRSIVCMSWTPSNEKGRFLFCTQQYRERRTERKQKQNNQP